MKQQSKQGGFTLIEILVVVAILGILTSIALPAYNDYIRKGQLQEAFTALSDYRVKMEQYFQDNKTYGANSCAPDATANSWNSFAPANRRYFTFSCATANSGQTYLLTATGNSSLTTGYAYTMDQAGNQKTKTYAGATSTSNCWRGTPGC